MPQPVTTILRDEQPLGQSFTNQFTDAKAPGNREATYRVEQTGRDGKVYASNNAQAPKPPEFLSDKAAERMVKENDLFDSSVNPSGKGILHQYREIERNGVKLVVDGATGLTWQKSGSDSMMIFDKALAYVTRLNATNYGGYNDWRLPTLKEAMQLMERKEAGDLYLASVFDRTLGIWTSDLRSEGMAWVINFYIGTYRHHNFNMPPIPFSCELFDEDNLEHLILFFDFFTERAVENFFQFLPVD